MTPAPQGTTTGDQPPGRAPAAETARLYALDWKAFAAWCRAADLATLPAAPTTVAAFLTDAGKTVGAGALGRRAAAIGVRHRQAGLPSPAADPAVRAILNAARWAATPRRPPPRRPAELLRMAATCPGDLAGLRDRALLLTATGCFPRAALVGLDVEDLRFTVTSVEVALHAAPADGDRVHRVSVPRGATLASCPVQALAEWLRRSDTRFGPVFRKINRGGTIEQHRLGTDALRRILARRAPRRRRRTRKASA
jgi:integrase